MRDGISVTRASIVCLAASVLLGACAMRPSASVTEPAVASRHVAAPAERRQPAAAPDTAAVPDASAAPDAAEPSRISAILEERRRGDYPEIELLDSGFTITEQVRVAGNARTEYERALVLLEQQRYDEGIAALESVTAAAPDATVPYIDLGVAYRETGALEQAEQALKNAALLSPDNPIALNELGIVYRQTGRFTEARASYERSLEVFSGYHYARRNLAVLCDLYLADLECALQNYTAYLDAVGADAEVEIWIADLRNRLGP